MAKDLRFTGGFVAEQKDHNMQGRIYLLPEGDGATVGIGNIEDRYGLLLGRHYYEKFEFAFIPEYLNEGVARYFYLSGGVLDDGLEYRGIEISKDSDGNSFVIPEDLELELRRLGLHSANFSQPLEVIEALKGIDPIKVRGLMRFIRPVEPIIDKSRIGAIFKLNEILE